MSSRSRVWRSRCSSSTRPRGPSGCWACGSPDWFRARLPPGDAARDVVAGQLAPTDVARAFGASPRVPSRGVVFLTMPLAKAGQIELSYDRVGDGPPLLLIMGMSGTKHHWGDARAGTVARVISRRSSMTIATPVTRPRRVNRSRSPTWPRDAAGLLEALELDSAHVMGISMGGMIAQELALAHPERIASLTLGCTYCGGEGSMLTSEAVMRRLAEAMSSGDRERAIRTAWEVNVSASFAANEDAYAQVPEDRHEPWPAGRGDHAADAGHRWPRHERPPARTEASRPLSCTEPSTNCSLSRTDT